MNWVDEALQVHGLSCVLQFLQSFRFDLTNAFARDFEDSTGFFQRVAVAIAGGRRGWVRKAGRWGLRLWPAGNGAFRFASRLLRHDSIARKVLH